MAVVNYQRVAVTYKLYKAVEWSTSIACERAVIRIDASPSNIKNRCDQQIR